MTVQVHEDILY